MKFTTELTIQKKIDVNETSVNNGPKSANETTPEEAKLYLKFGGTMNYRTYGKPISPNSTFVEHEVSLVGRGTTCIIRKTTCEQRLKMKEKKTGKKFPFVCKKYCKKDSLKKFKVVSHSFPQLQGTLLEAETEAKAEEKAKPEANAVKN